MLGSKAKRELKRNQRRILIDSIEIGIPSPHQIYTWGERRLPNGKKVGEIKNSKTVNYKRFTPLRDGLFCERIFGPVNSFVCACGKRQPRANVTFCEKCEVEYTDQHTRRYRLGYIPLISPVAHIWYLKGRPSYLSLFLGKRKKRIIALAYCNAYLVEQAFYQAPRPSLYLAPTDVISHTKEREAHGVNRYTKNIQSSRAIRHISNRFYNSPKNNSHTSQSIPASFQENILSSTRRENAQFTNSPIDAAALNKSSALIKGKQSTVGIKSEKGVYISDNSSSHPENAWRGHSPTTLTNNSVKHSSFYRFQQKINKTTSPSLFSHLLAEVYGHIEKDVVLTDSSKKESTHTNKGKQSVYPLTNQASSLKKSKSETLLSLRPLWGYTYSEHNNQDLRSYNPLLSRAKNSFGLRQEKATVSLYAGVSPGVSPAFNKKSISAYRSFADLLSYKRNSIPTALSLAFSYTKKKAFQVGPRNSISQLSLKAIYQPFFCLSIERWLASIFTFWRKGSKKLYSYSEKDWQLQGSYFHKNREKVLDVYHIPFFSFLMANLHTKCGETRIATLKEQKSKDVTSDNPEKTDKENQRFSTGWTFQHKIAANWQSESQNLYSKENKKIQTAQKNSARKDLTDTRSTAAQVDLCSSTHEPSLPITAQTPQRVLNIYNRAHTFPFLPHLICKYNLRDELLNCLYSSPFDEDRPIYPYCHLERWQALRDVHKFMSEQIILQSTEDGHSQENISDETQPLPIKTPPGIVTASVTSPETKEPASAKQFLSSITQSDGENSSDMLLNNFNSKSQKINRLSLQSEPAWKRDERRYAAWVKRSRASDRDASFLQLADRAAKEYTLSEKLASLRHILYIALLEKDFSLRSQELAARTRQMSCLYSCISREKYIYDSIKLSRFAEAALHISTDKGTKQNVTPKAKPANKPSGRFNYNLRGSKILRKRICATTYTNSTSFYRRFQESILKLPNSVVKRDAATIDGPDKRTTDFGVTIAENKNAVTTKSRAFLQPTQADQPLQELLLSRRLALRGKTTTPSKRIHPFHYLLRKSSSQSRYGSKLKETLSLSNARRGNATAGDNSHLKVPTRVAQFKKVSSLIGLANTLQLKSPESSYRSLLFDKSWVRSFLLEKNLLEKTRYPTICVTKLLTSSKTKGNVMRNQDELTLSPQTRPVPSYVHAFRQHANKKNQFNSYTLLIQNAWPLKNKKTAVSGPSTLLRSNRTSYGVIESVLQTPGVKTPPQYSFSQRRRVKSVGKRVRFLNKSFAQQDCNIVNNIVKKSISTHEKRLINRVYNLTFFVHNSGTETTKEAFSTYIVIPSCGTPTKSAETIHPTPPSDIGQTKTRVATSVGDATAGVTAIKPLTEVQSAPWRKKPDVVASKYRLPGVVQQDKESLASSALSFFLVLPHSHKVKDRQTDSLTSTERGVSAPETLGDSTQIVENHKSLQVQLKNGNSQLLNKPQSILNTFSHHVQTDSNCLEIAQKSSSNTSRRLKRLAAESSSLLSKDQLPTEVELANATPPLNGNNPSQSLDTVKYSTSKVYQVPAAYRNYSKASILRDHSNNGAALLGEGCPEGTSVSVQDGYRVNRGVLERINASTKSSPTRDISTSLIQLQQKAKKASGSVNRSTLSRQDSTCSSLELTTIREILSYTGGGALQKLLQRFDTQLFANFLFADIKATRAIYKQKVLQRGYSPSRIQKRVLTRLCRRIHKNSRRLKIAQLFTRCKRRPEWMMISVLPVLPPDLRPILQMSESVVVASDLNNLYQRVVYRNNRFYKLNFIDFYLVTAIQRLVQDAVDRLIENGKGGSKPFYTPGGRPLKSLSDTLKGKKGRFRLNLLGKRVDFSGRSVIVVSPSLRVHECGIPREIALELYHYFLLRQLMLRKQASSIIMAKKIIQQRNPFVWDVLRDIVYHHPVLLNRAPTLHRLGIQAFQPKLVKGSAILLNPLVCSGFNADFDGDQMGVHLPLSTQARAEAWDLLWSRNNLLSPATGQAVLVPSQDMVLGFYYMTQSFSSRSLFTITDNKKHESKQLGGNAVDIGTPGVATLKHTTEKVSEPKNNLILRSNIPKYRRLPTARELVSVNRVFLNCLELLKAFQNKSIHLHTPVWLQWQGKMENDEGSQTPLELRINNFGSSTYIYSKYKRRKDESLSKSTLYIRTTAGRVLVNSILF